MKQPKKKKPEIKLTAQQRAGQKLRAKFTTYPVKESGELLDFLMKAKDGISRNSAKSLLSHRQVLVDNVITTQYNFPLKAGMKVQISKDKGKKEFTSAYIKILYEDSYMLVVNKREGLLTIGTDKTKERTAHAILNEYVQRSGRQHRVYVVNRLEKDASGILLFAKDEKTKFNLQDNWEQIVKEYRFVAVVSGIMENDNGAVASWMVDDKLYIAHSSISNTKGDKAVTRYKTIKRANGYSLVELETGKRNQIRLHMNDLKHPVLGDIQYNREPNPMERLALHAFKLVFRHPVTEDKMEFTTPYPSEFKGIMLRKASNEND